MPALQQVADPKIAAIVVLTVTRQEPVHDPANRVRLSLNQQVNVISHQAVSMQKEREFSLLHREQRQELLIVRGRIEYLPAIIAASNDVIKTTLDFGAFSSGHGPPMLAPTSNLINALRRLD
jgi:hypothetical protein